MDRPEPAPRTTAPRTTAPLIHRVLGPFQRFFSMSAASGLVLLACTVVALAWANSPWSDSYHHFWETRFTIGALSRGLTLSVHGWVNDGLMTVFFFLVGLEIKREILVGELSSRRTAALPVAAAFGGMIVPAAIYAAINAGGPGSSGWGMPMATDIAFALGVLALLGDRMPNGLRVFLAALAIADDLGAVLVIALFYTSALDWSALAGAAVVLAALAALNWSGARRSLTYALLGVVLWLFVLTSGIHATIAGVLLALAIPADGANSPLHRMERALQTIVSFVIMPIFALANAGVPVGDFGNVLHSPVALGVILGLFLGKPIGITLASHLAVRSGAGELPEGVSWKHIHGAAWLGGIGFTMSLFIGGLAFTNVAMLDTAKLAVLCASTAAGVVGYLVLRRGA